MEYFITVFMGKISLHCRYSKPPVQSVCELVHIIVFGESQGHMLMFLIGLSLLQFMTGLI